jgi:hypothetical protein
MSHAPAEPELQDSHLDFAWKTHEYINNYIRFADTKAAFVVAWSSAIIGTLYVGHLHEAVMQSRFTLNDISFTTTLAALALPLLSASFLGAAWSIIPRLPTKQRSGLVFWESILVHASGDLYANALGRNDGNQLARHLCVQIHTIAAVARKKYFCVTVSMWLAFFGTILGILAILFKAA